MHFNGAVIFQVNLRNTEAEYYIKIHLHHTTTQRQKAIGWKWCEKKMPSLTFISWKKKRRKINNANLQTWNRFWFDLIEYQFQALKESIYLFFLINLLCYAVAVCSVHCAGYNSLSQHASMPFTYTLYTYDFHVNAKDSKNSFAHIFIYSCKSVAINFSICTRIWNRV